MTTSAGSAGAAPRAGLRPTALPAGYRVLTSVPISAAPGVQTHAEVACPAKTAPVSGGSWTNSPSLLVNMSSSYAVGLRNWAVNLNNASATSASVTIYAVCVKMSPANFSTGTANVTVSAGSESQATASCPFGVVVGGGLQTQSANTAVNLVSLYPSASTAWTGWVSNASGSDVNVTVTAICRNPAPHGIKVVEGLPTSNPPGAQTDSAVVCPGARVPLSGGLYSDGVDLGENMGSSAPFGNAWINVFNNASVSDHNTVHTWVVCAGS